MKNFFFGKTVPTAMPVAVPAAETRPAELADSAGLKELTIRNYTDQELTRREEVLAPSVFYKHWTAIKAEGITASQFIEFLQPLADLDGISVSFIYQDDAGKERVYNHRKNDGTYENPLSQAIREKKLTRERALSFALNDEGRVWVESNFMELK